MNLRYFVYLPDYIMHSTDQNYPQKIWDNVSKLTVTNDSCNASFLDKGIFTRVVEKLL